MPLHCSFFRGWLIEYATTVRIERGLVVKAKDDHIRDMRCKFGFPYKFVYVRNFFSFLFLCATKIANDFRIDLPLANMSELHSSGGRLFRKF